MKKITLMIACAAVLLSGCATSVYKSEAFAPTKRYAVVSITAEENIDGGGPGSGTTLSGMLKAVVSTESGFKASSAKILEETAPRIMKALTAQNRFIVLPDKTTKSNAGFKAATSDEPVAKLAFLETRYNVAPGYKFFADEQKLGELARKMKVDGVITVRLYYKAGESKVGIGGVLAAGTHSGITLMQIWAVNDSGQRIWADTFSETSKDSVGFVGDAVNFVTLHPLLLQSTDAAIASMVAKLGKGY